MRNRVSYEWKVEWADKYSDIEDCDHFDCYRDAFNRAAEPHEYHNVSVCLVRGVGNEDDGILDREHAYVFCGELEEAFEAGTPVPKKFLAEVKKINAA